MSGIVGIWNLDGEPVDRSVLERMSATLAHRGPDGEGLHIDSSIGMACQNLQVTSESIGEIQPLICPSGQMIVFDGRLDNREAILTKLEYGTIKDDNISDAALTLAAYRLYGKNLPERLNGDYAFAIYDSECQTLLLARDAIGVRPLYYCRKNNLFIFASEIKALLAHPQVSTRPHDKALASLLIGGDSGYGGSKGSTFFEGIYSVPPAYSVLITSNKLQAKQYWDFDPAHPIRFDTFQEYTDAFQQYFEVAVQRRIRSAFPVAVAVSGGLDSSAIFCQAESLRRDYEQMIPVILGYSWVYDDGTPADEKKFLTEIEQEYGAEIQRIRVTSENSFQMPIKMMWHSESPLLISNPSDIQSLHGKVTGAGVKTILTGHWGDQALFNRGYLIDLFYRFEWSKIFRHLEEYPRWMPDADPIHFTRRVFYRNLIKYHAPDILRCLLRQIRRRLDKKGERQIWYTKKLQDLAYQCHTTHTVPAGHRCSAHFKSFYEMFRSSYYVLCMEENNKMASLSGLDMAYPFLDRDLLSFLMNIPGEMLAENGCPKALLRKSMQGILPNAIIERRGKANFTDQANETLEKNFVQLASIFQGDALAIKYGYVKSEILSLEFMTLKDQIHASNDAVLLWQLEKLFGLELWLEIFFGKRPITT